MMNYRHSGPSETDELLRMSFALPDDEVTDGGRLSEALRRLEWQNRQMAHRAARSEHS